MADGPGQPGHIPVPPDLQKTTPEAGNNLISLLAAIPGPVPPPDLWFVDPWGPTDKLYGHVPCVGTVSCWCQGESLLPHPEDRWAFHPPLSMLSSSPSFPTSP